MARAPIIVGLLGGIASGKSTVATLLRRRGARVVDADRLAHEVLELPAVRTEVAAVFGPGAYGPDGRPDRGRIAGEAFADPEKLRKLEEIVHPRVRERVRAELEAATGAPAVVLDAPLLLEGGLWRIADVLVFVEAPAAARSERAGRTRGWADGEVERREARQAPLEEKRRAARFTVVNDGTLEDLDAKIAGLWGRILGAGTEELDPQGR